MESKNVYYVALSAAQKAIRQGTPERAVNWAKVAWQIDKKAMFKRMWTWFFEDCGPNLEAAQSLYSYRGGLSDFDGLMSIVALLASGPKCKDIIPLAGLLRSHKSQPIATYAALRPVAPVLAEIQKDWSAYGWDGMERTLTFKPEFDWVITFAQRAMKFCEGGYPVGWPYLFSEQFCGFKAPENEIGQICLIAGGLPCSAIDGHTRPGMSAISTFVRLAPEIGVTDPYDFKEYLFVAEGGLCNNLTRCNIDFEKMWHKLSKEDKWDDGRYVAAIQKNINGLHQTRAKVLRGQYASDLAALFDMYKKDFVKV